MKPFKVYVASRWTDKPRVRATIAELIAAGHVITFDWTQVADNPHTESVAKRRYNVKNAKLDFAGVVACDYLVMFALPRVTGAQGAWVEFGAALALQKGIVIVGVEDLIADADPCVFTWMDSVQRVPDVPSLIAYLDAERGVGMRAEAATRHSYAGVVPISDAIFDDEQHEQEEG